VKVFSSKRGWSIERARARWQAIALVDDRLDISAKMNYSLCAFVFFVRYFSLGFFRTKARRVLLGLLIYGNKSDICELSYNEKIKLNQLPRRYLFRSPNS
jgi:hypothetical protein